ncbi:MAG TPA: KH domain-containing protein [Candidatus Nanoarchaeia archaeon]|nr:KH domain-containing protein [Candidatus Nanoarchaeia archaeon]
MTKTIQSFPEGEPEDSFMHELKIPKERIAVIIGKKGETKRQLEAATKARLSVDSIDGDVRISGNDPIILMVAKDIITAIGRGFSPDTALLLLNPEYGLEMIDIREYAGKSKNKALRIKSRVIGTEGKSRVNLERLTETYFSVYGKTIAIIGKPENVFFARRAVEKLLEGAEHSTVYRWLEKKRKEFVHGSLSAEDLQLRETGDKDNTSSEDSDEDPD